MKFEYLKPETLEEALSLLINYAPQAKVIGGGTDLVLQMKHQLVRYSYVVDLSELSGMRRLEFSKEEGVRVGAAVTIREMELSSLLQQRFPLLAGAARTLGSIAIRNVATVGGNLCNASPSADMAPALIGLGAKLKVRGPEGEYELGLDKLFTGPGTTILDAKQILTEIIIPPIPERVFGVYFKHYLRRGSDLALASVASVIHFNEDGTCLDARIVLGAVASTPIRALESEAILKGQRLEKDVIKSAGVAATRSCIPINDVRASAEYRRHLVVVLTQRALHRVREDFESQVSKTR